MTDGDIDAVLSVAGRGNGEQRGDRPALDDLEVIVDQAPFDVLGRPKCASIRRPSCASRTTCASVSAGCSCRSGSIACSCVPPAGEAWMARCLVAIALATTSPSRTCRRRHSPDRRPGPRRGRSWPPRMKDLPVARDGVGREKDAGRLREDHLLHDHGHVDLPVVEAVPQAVGHGPLGEEQAQHRLTCWRIAAGPTTFRYVLLAREGGRRASPPPSRWIGRRRRLARRAGRAGG